MNGSFRSGQAQAAAASAAIECAREGEKRTHFLGYGANLSETGVFVQSLAPRPPGTRLNLVLHLGGVNGARICSEAEVRWCRGYGGKKGPSAGMGLRFTGMRRPIAARCSRAAACRRSSTRPSLRARRAPSDAPRVEAPRRPHRVSREGGRVLWIGLMSGTSADAVDAALVRVGRDPGDVELIAFRGEPIEDALRERIHARSAGRRARCCSSTSRSARASPRGARVARGGVPLASPRHRLARPDRRPLSERDVRGTLQIGAAR
jgi:hypothetical protein